MAMFAADLAATGCLRPGHTVDSAADLLWLAMDVRNHDWLVRPRDWSSVGLGVAALPEYTQWRTAIDMSYWSGS
jgi:hypothetical protein